ncbi:hypothetical protein PR003_g26206 [Phytophthora rubi]|uniref:START domain-containing protein n=1 Tax=Phytophthora rubi TaxID=129364 RepID=A0A6A4CBK8_9STRA|nr:hypothetical protein PR003_g26206 [Phytophthora rubi]
MTKDWFAANPYPNLHLSEEQKHQLVDLVNEFVEGYYQEYEDFVTIDNRRVDEQRWKHFKSKDDLHVYEDRYRQESDQDMEPWNSASTDGEDVVPIKSDMPVVLRVGTVLGRLDDLMFGCVNPTLDVMRIRASYVHDVHTGAVLCPVIETSKEEPFRSLIVKWLTLDNPFESTNLIKTRDFVYIKATGILHFASGDRVGYHIKHSIEFPQTKPQPNVIRAKMSYCSFFRQIHTNVIDMFGTSTMVPGGDIRRFISIRVAADALLSTANLVFCGQVKKLSWMLQQQRSRKPRELMEEDIDMDDGKQPFTGAPQSAMPLTVDGDYASVDPHTIPSATARASEIPQSSSIGGNGAADEVRRHHPHLDSPTGLVPIDTGAEAGILAFFAGGVCGSDEDDSCELGALSRRLACMETGSFSHKLGSISCPRMVTRFWLEAAAGSPPLLVTELVLGGVDMSVLYS